MTKYRVYELSARAVMSYAGEKDGQYMFCLDRTATEKCKIQAASHEQDSSALFFQIMCALRGAGYRERGDGQIVSDLSDVIFYMDFDRVFDRSTTNKKPGGSLCPKKSIAEKAENLNTLQKKNERK